MIRPATVDDIPEIHAMIRELAEYERALEHARATEDQLRHALFDENPAVFALIAESGPVDGGGTPGEAVGFALWFRNFSTWTGTHGIYLEDLYVRPHARGSGHGKALLTALAAICGERGYQRLEWSVLDWNESSINFYKSLGAEQQHEWQTFRLSGAPLSELATTRSN